MKPIHVTPDTLKQDTEKTKKKSFKQAHRRAAETTGQGSGGLSRKGVPSIELYQTENCPYSHAVRTRLTELGLDFIAHTVAPGLALKHEQLVHAGGKDQIPFLVDHKSGIKLYESGAILAYLENEYGSPAKSQLHGVIRKANHSFQKRRDQLVWRFRMPIERALSYGTDLRDTVQTLTGSYRVFRTMVREAVQSARSQRQGRETRKAS